MCGTGCEDCNGAGCPSKASEMKWDGNLSFVSVPAGATVADVISLLEQYIATGNSCSDANYTLTAYNACLGLAAGTYSFNQIIGAILPKLCSTASDLADLTVFVNTIATSYNTTTVLLDGLVIPSCLLPFAGTTTTDLLQEIIDALCGLLSTEPPDTGNGGVIVVSPDPDAEADPDAPKMTDYGKKPNIDYVAEVVRAIIDNDDFIYDHTSPTTSTTSFTVRIAAIRGFVNGFLIIRNITEDLTVNATMDTYFYLSGDGTILRREVAVGAPAPAKPAGSYNLYKMESDGSGVVSVTNLFVTSALNPIPLGADDVTTINILDGAVTSAKIDPVITAKTAGNAALFYVEVNDAGQVIDLTANMLLSGLSNGQILTYNSGLNRFENSDNTYVPAVTGTLAKSNGAGNYTDSQIVETASQIEASRKVEINTGAKENDANAGLNVVGAPILLPRLTHTEAGALPLTDGYIVYVTSTDATFTSVGVWAVENVTWVKL